MVTDSPALGPWKRRAACLDPDGRGPRDDVDMFATTTAGREAALALCRQCPVRADCLAHALEHDERFGIWGGKDERERRQIKRAALRAARRATR